MSLADRGGVSEERYKAKSALGTVHHAAETGDLARLAALVKEGLQYGHPESVTLQTREDLLGMFPLHSAAEHGQEGVVEYLLKRQVDVDGGDNYRVTPMHLAAIGNHVTIVRMLIKARANVKPADIDGDQPLHWAATKGHVEMIELLMRSGHPIDQPNSRGWTPLHRAAYNGRKQACEVLFRAGAKLDAVNKDGNTPLHLACFMNQLFTIEKLCGLGAKLDAANKDGKTPWELCITDAARDAIQGFGFEFKPQAPKTTINGGGGPELQSQPITISSDFSQLAVDIKQVARAKAGRDDFPSPTSASPAVTAAAGLSSYLNSNAMLLEMASDMMDNPYTNGRLAPSNTTPVNAQTPGGLSGNGSAIGSRILSRTSSVSGTRPQGGLEAERSSGGPGRSSLTKHASAANGRVPEPSHSGSGLQLPSERSSPGAPRTSAHNSNPLAKQNGAGLGSAGLQQPQSLAPLATDRSSRSELSPWAGITLEGSMAAAAAANGQLPAGGGAAAAQDYQALIKEENRRAVHASADVLAPKNRPQSGNKKFLRKYSLDKHNLFAP